MTDKTAGDSGGSSKGGRKQPRVVSSNGERQRFLRGMVTHDLIQRGLDFELAYTIARTIRDQIADREEVTTRELRTMIQQRLEAEIGADLPATLKEPVRRTPELVILRSGASQPFSRGLLARSIHAAGIELDRAYQLVTQLLLELQGEGVTEIPLEEITRRISQLLESKEGRDAARRYRLVRRIQRLPRPMVIYIGGASGTGKSTLALELAPLLRIYRINASDTIRQVMRMMFSPQVLPSLYASSFEVSPAFGAQPEEHLVPSGGETEFGRKLVATFEEQSQRVLVGVRAVVERAIAENMNVLVEGVHVYPPRVPFPDLEGAIYQVPLVLGTLDREAHRMRFLTRARHGGRRAERYLENFDAIRMIQDFILEQAEAHDVPLIDTSGGDPQVVRALLLVTGTLQREVPELDRKRWEERSHPAPTLLVVIDGLADRPVRALGGRTPLQAANIPTLDRLARDGLCGIADPVTPGVVPDTAQGCLALFGQSPLAIKRGPVEVLGTEIPLDPEDVALRGNLATLNEAGQVIDRRAGRIREGAAELARSLDRLAVPGGHLEGVEVRVAPATEHRLAIVIKGRGLSSAIHGSDPGEGASPGPPITPSPEDPRDSRAVHTARVLALFEQEARRVLADHPVNRKRRRKGLPEANAILTRGAGRIHQLPRLEEAGLPLHIACIGGDLTVLGLARWLGADVITRPEMTANLDTDLHSKFTAARKALRKYDLVVLHLKGADIAAHDKRPDLKVEFLERIDKELGGLLAKHKEPMRVAVAADHATLSESGQHAADPLPVLISGDGIEADEVQTYDEKAATAGRLQRFPLQMLLGRLYDLG